MALWPIITMNKIMLQDAKIYVAGHRGLVGSALLRHLQTQGYTNICTRSHNELDLLNQVATLNFFEQEQPEYVFLAAARVGGIMANQDYPAQFLYENIAIQNHVIHAAWKNKVKRLLFLGSSCIYPKNALQPMSESCLLTGSLESTNRPYAIAKIAGIEMCWSYNRQYGTRYLSVMPTNLYGPGDNYHAHNSHVIPALIRKCHEAKLQGSPYVVIWGTGTPRREFLYSEDMAEACVHVMNLPNTIFDTLLGNDPQAATAFSPPTVNIGTGKDQSIAQLAALIKRVVGYSGELIFDDSKPDGALQKLLDVSRLHALGWHATTSLEIGLQRVYEDFIKHSAETAVLVVHNEAFKNDK